jgi:hypothetical protein
LDIFGPAWLSEDCRGKALELQVLPGCSAPVAQSCTVELRWAHEGRRATAGWVMKQRVAGQDLAVEVSVDGAGPAAAEVDEGATYPGQEHSSVVSDAHLQFSFAVKPSKSSAKNGDADSSSGSSDSSEFNVTGIDGLSLASGYSADPPCAPPSGHLLARLRHVLTRPSVERSCLIRFENRTPFNLTLLPAASMCSEGAWSDSNIWEGGALPHYTPAGPPGNVVPFSTVVFGCESSGAKTGVAGRLLYHVHVSEGVAAAAVAAAAGGFGGAASRVAVSWATPFFGKRACTYELLPAAVAGSGGVRGRSSPGKADDRASVSSSGSGGSRPLVVEGSATVRTLFLSLSIKLLCRLLPRSAKDRHKVIERNDFNNVRAVLHFNTQDDNHNEVCFTLRLGSRQVRFLAPTQTNQAVPGAGHA